ncbi:MAG TPA: M3 family metallopeptidase, partial [Thermoanaerobaculia bacterium]|nr:M3 family metallopeptidase [Thermoanaerobaculia bacterium]
MSDHHLNPDRPAIPILQAAEIATRAEEALAAAKRLVAAIESSAEPAEHLFEIWNQAAIQLEDAFGPISLLNSVHPDKDVRDATDDALVEEASFMTELFQREAFYRRVHEAEPRSAAERQLKKDLLEAFEDSGVSLDPEKRARFKEISARLTELGQEFARNIRDNPERLTFKSAECEGLPQSWLDRVPRDDEGNVVVGFDYPDYVPFMTNSRNEEARKRYYIANTNRGTPRNLEVLDEIVALRKEIADLYEVPTFAHYVTRRQMVQNPETVLQFLGEVRHVVEEAEKRDLAELSAVKAEMAGVPPDDATIHRWEMTFYRERLRERRFAVDQEELRRYFPTAGTVAWMIDVSERLYGLRFVERPVAAWHPDVRYLDVHDAESSSFVGGIYLDLYPREGKYKHA